MEQEKSEKSEYVYHLTAEKNPRRSPTYGIVVGAAEKCPKERSLEMFRRICAIRFFELEVKKAREAKHVKSLVYLSVGQESVAAATATVMQGSWVTYQHRCHGFFLTYGGDPRALIDELLTRETGANRGMGGSNYLQDISKKIIGHNGLIGDNVPIATGVAYARKKHGEKVVCYFGDGAAEEDYVLGAFGFAASHKLPILFICDDNDLSVLTPTRDRRTWEVDEVARSFGMPAVDITDDPWTIEHYTREFSTQLPAVINIRNCRELWHQGTGVDGVPEWHRFNLTKQKLVELGLGSEAEKIESEEKAKAGRLWQEQLRIPSEK